MGDQSKTTKKALTDRIADIVFAGNPDTSGFNLVEEIEKTRLEMENAMINYNAVSEEELLDFYIYQFKAAQVKYDYLTRLARQEKIAE